MIDLTRILLFAVVAAVAALAQGDAPKSERVRGAEKAGASQAAPAAQAAQATQAARSFDEYWNRGLAEIARYDLVQSRYGEPRRGHALLVFVTEDFRRDLQVKDESGRGDSTKVLKLNRIQRFTTGIYDYSLMQSVFTPVDRKRDPHTLKTTASVQDWCGHAWMQLNRGEEGYAITGHSYFEQENDERRVIDAKLLEDELWTLIRIDPELLPQGEVEIVPASFDARLRHFPLAAERATAALRDGAQPSERIFELRYGSGRSLVITFDRELPHGIKSFKETQGDLVTLLATRTHVVREDYWNHHGRKDDGKRAELGLK